MNIKLLKELYKQAETECGWSEEKFAELIVRECIQAIQNESKDPMDELEYGLRVAEGAILDYFGVEE